MTRWRTSCVYRAGRYPVVALADLFFLLLLLFVLSNSMLYLRGVLMATDAGEEPLPDDGLQVSSLVSTEDFSEYVVADKMVLVLDDEGGLELNKRGVALESLEAELEAEAGKLLRMYRGQERGGGEHGKAFRPKLVLSVSPQVPWERLNEVIAKIRSRRMDVVLVSRGSRG